ncbi:MAG: hypothetical protein U1A16_01675 [Patescibacteria group bacterium]|nr:hypothetical protein [Patescibacteria group bacterium]
MEYQPAGTILFVIRSVDQLRYYQSIIEALLRRGYRVRALFDKRWSRDSTTEALEEMKRLGRSFDYGWATPRTDRWRSLLFYLRELRSCRRYLLVSGQSAYYRERWFSYLPRTLRILLKTSLLRSLLKSSLCGTALRFAEHFIPPDERIRAELKEDIPAVVATGPVNMRFSSADLEYLKAARNLGIPTVLPVYSWDNLTTKGLIHILPDLVLVWNQAQAQEAKEHHGIGEKRVRISGAPFFDAWFSYLRPATPREVFCARYGLRSKDPIILYLGSSMNIAKDEIWLIKALRQALDTSTDKRLSSTQLIVRPHPANARIYESFKERDTIVLPRGGEFPTGERAFQLFSDTLGVSVAAVSVNTSAMIEAIIADKPVIAIMPEAYRSTQMETQHFRHFLEVRAVECARSVEQCVKLIESLLDGKDRRVEGRRMLVRHFIRPCGSERQAGEIAADHIEVLWRKNKNP